MKRAGNGTRFDQEQAETPCPGIRRALNIEISVCDNGIGIPDHLKNKIFQPFFTTKPTGQGTGLGLALSYDIITIVHNGKIDLKTTGGTEFVIVLPQ